MAFIDVVSPCVAFNNHNGSTKSYDYVRGHTQNVVDADYISGSEEITADYAPGTTEEVAMPGGSVLRLHKIDDSYNPHDRVEALHYIQTRQAQGEVATGLLYVENDPMDCHDILNTVKAPLNSLSEVDLCPGHDALAAVNESYR